MFTVFIYLLIYFFSPKGMLEAKKYPNPPKKIKKTFCVLFGLDQVLHLVGTQHLHQAENIMVTVKYGDGSIIPQRGLNRSRVRRVELKNLTILQLHPT